MISIVIPSYNQQEFLSDALDSALWQNAHEVIMVDDGSTDNSLKIAEGYWKKGGLKLISQVNKGLSAARNTGVMNATGDYVLFLDADDILLEGAVSKIQKVIDETGADIVAPSFKCFGLNNEPVILMANPKLEDFKPGNRIGYCQAIRRDVLLEVGGYSPRMALGYEDLHLTYNLLTRGKKLVTIQEVLWLYRTKPNSMIQTAMQHHGELMAQIQKDFPDAF